MKPPPIHLLYVNVCMFSVAIVRSHYSVRQYKSDNIVLWAPAGPIHSQDMREYVVVWPFVCCHSHTNRNSYANDRETIIVCILYMYFENIL